MQFSSEDGDSDECAAAADPYQGHGGGILEVLNDAREKAEGELSEPGKAEVNSNSLSMYSSEQRLLMRQIRLSLQGHNLSSSTATSIGSRIGVIMHYAGSAQRKKQERRP